MIAQGDFQKVLFANTEERGKIFRQIFGTDIYRVLQDKLKDAVKKQWKEYDELRRSINQYMEGIVCESDSLDEEGTRIAEKINLLKKEKFDGRIEEGISLLEELCKAEESVLECLQKEKEALDQQIKIWMNLAGKCVKMQTEGGCWKKTAEAEGLRSASGAGKSGYGQGRRGSGML